MEHESGTISIDGDRADVSDRASKCAIVRGVITESSEVELGFETLYRHFACRFYPGYAKVINFSSYTCSNGQGCDPQGASELWYFGMAFGYAF